MHCEPVKGHYRFGSFPFTVSMPTNYPFASPTVSSQMAVFHPNIDPLTKRVSIHILHKWSPVLSLNDVVYEIALLFHIPNRDGLQSTNQRVPMDKTCIVAESQKLNRLGENSGNRRNASSFCSESVVLIRSAMDLYLINREQFESTVRGAIKGRHPQN